MEDVEQRFGRRAVEWVGASQGIYFIVHDRQTVYGNNRLQVRGQSQDEHTGRAHSREVYRLGSTRTRVDCAYVAA